MITGSMIIGSTNVHYSSRLYKWTNNTNKRKTEKKPIKMTMYSMQSIACITQVFYITCNI